MANGQSVKELALEVIGCFDAAEVEGLSIVLAETTDARLKDLVERRLMHALYAAQQAAPEAPSSEQQALDDVQILNRWAEQVERLASTFNDERALLCQQAAVLLSRIAYTPAATTASDPDGKFALGMLTELPRMGASPAGLELATHLFGVGPCPACGFRKLHCRCPGKATTASASATEGWQEQYDASRRAQAPSHDVTTGKEST